MGEGEGESRVVEQVPAIPGVRTRNGLYGWEFREVDKRRRQEGTRRKVDAKQLWQRSHEILNLAARGFSNKKIAKIMGVAPATVSNTINSELGERKLSELRKGRDIETIETVDRINRLTEKALDVYHEIFDDPANELTLKDRGKFAFGFLREMSGHRAPTKIQSHNINTTLSAEEIEEFKNRGKKAAEESGLIIDIEEEEEDGNE